MTEHIFTNYSDAADALRIKDLKQSLYDDGEVIMDQVLVCLHGEEHKKRRKLENKIADHARVFKKNDKPFNKVITIITNFQAKMRIQTTVKISYIKYK